MTYTWIRYKYLYLLDYWRIKRSPRRISCCIFHNIIILSSTSIRASCWSQKLSMANILWYGMDGSFVKFYGTYPKLHYTIYHCHVCRSRYGCISSSGIHNGCQTQWQQKIIFTSHIYCHGKCGMGINTSLFCTSCKQVRYENITHLCHTRIIYQFFILDHFKKSNFYRE